MLRTSTAALLGAALWLAPSAHAAEPYVVVLKPGATLEPSTRDRLEVLHTYDTALEGLAARMDAEALAAVEADPAVAFVEPDQPVHAQNVQALPPWGLDRIDQRARPLDDRFHWANSGAGVNVWVVDSGARRSHAEFDNRRAWGYGFDLVDGGPPDDCHGHGTHVAGTIAGGTSGVAKNTRIVVGRVLDCEGAGTVSTLIAAVDQITRESPDIPGPEVVNLSAGGTASDALDQAVAASIASGLTYVVAAGNDGGDACDVSPARVPAAITVGATDRTDRRAATSNRGACLDLFAPGVDIVSAWHTNDRATAALSGTSMAAAHVAGAAAVFLQGNPEATPAQVAAALVSASTRNVVSDAGTTPNRLLHNPTTAIPAPDPECGNQVSTGTLAHGQSIDVDYVSRNQFPELHSACLTGPPGTDFDLTLIETNASVGRWRASSESPFSLESIFIDAGAHTYAWRISSYFGGGPWTLHWRQP